MIRDVSQDPDLTVKNKRPTTMTSDQPTYKRVRVHLPDRAERRSESVDVVTAAKILQKDRFALGLSQTHKRRRSR